jgi:hypothetical protein
MSESANAVDPRNAAMIESVLIASPVAQALGIRFDALAAERVEMLLPFSMKNITVGDMVHGGVIATLIDVAARRRRSRRSIWMSSRPGQRVRCRSSIWRRRGQPHCGPWPR